MDVRFWIFFSKASLKTNFDYCFHSLFFLHRHRLKHFSTIKQSIKQKLKIFNLVANNQTNLLKTYKILVCSDKVKFKFKFKLS